MKRILLPLCLILAVVAAVKLAAQSPTPANSPAQTTNAPSNIPEATPSPSPTAPIEPPSLIPENILPAPNALPKIPVTPNLEALNAFFKQTSLGKEADEQRLHLETARLEIQIRNDPELHELRAKALRQKTDLELRHHLRTYYQVYYQKLHDLTTDPELQAHITAEGKVRQIGLLQPRTRHEMDEPAVKALGNPPPGASVAPAPTPVQAKVRQGLRP